MVFTISSTSLLRIQSGNASTPPKDLNSTHLPSITGIAASGPISPSPSTAVPSVTTRQRFHLLVSSYDLRISFCISRQGAATPGVYASDKSSLFLTGTADTTSIFPFQLHSAFQAFFCIIMSIQCHWNTPIIMKFFRQLTLCFTLSHSFCTVKG